MSQLTVIAKLKAKAGTEEKLYEECRKLIAPTLGEEGCMNYDLYRSTEDPGTFMSYENWAQPAALGEYMESTHLKAFPNNTDGMIEVWENCFSARKLPIPNLRLQ